MYYIKLNYIISIISYHISLYYCHWVGELPLCASMRLLAPRSPFVLPLKRYFMDLPDPSRRFNSAPRPGVTNHVFTDGSHFTGTVPNLNRSAWAVVNATNGDNISHGCVRGLLHWKS